MSAFLEAVAADVGRVFINEFREDATYTPDGGAERTLPLIFDRISEVTDIGEMMRLDGVAALAYLETKLAPELAHGDVMTVRSVTYRVVGIEPDGTGVTMIQLGI